jgi:transcriptional regulator GlxA family with amidase domain
MHAAPHRGAMLGSTLLSLRLHCMNSAEPLPLQSIDGAPKQRIRFGIILLPNFTLTAFSGFVDLLRLSADEGDFSKPVRCSWSVIGETLAPVRASCGIQITPWETFDGAEPFDYVVVACCIRDRLRATRRSPSFDALPRPMPRSSACAPACSR